MSNLEALRGLQTTWQSDESLQAALNRAFDTVGFNESYVERCIKSKVAQHAPLKTKYIKDNVWGMIEVEWPTIRLLDCPIIQRLRGIKQLGLTYLTYPSAEHSRFIHSLGMYNVVSRFLDAIDKRAQEIAESDLQYVGVTNLAPLMRDEILHAAILHDVGHMPFSHATERVLAGLEDQFTCGKKTIREFKQDIDLNIRKAGGGLSLSESLSLLVVLSSRFEYFYQQYVCRGAGDSDSLLRIASLIAGIPPNKRLTGVTEIISSAAVDADKVDYVNRDARECGIPVGIDVSRIFLRSGFVRASRDRLSRLKKNPADEEIVFVVNASGMDTIDEITEARAALYHRVYLHAVTRTAEATLARTLLLNTKSSDGSKKLADALALWAMSDNELLHCISEISDNAVRMLGRRLIDRELPKKACVYSSSLADIHLPLQTMFGEIAESTVSDIRKQVANTPLETLTRDSLDAKLGSVLEQEISDEAKRIVETVTKVNKKLRPEPELSQIAMVGSVVMDRQRKDCIILQNGRLLRSAEFTNVDKQKDAFDIFKATGYVMCDSPWRVAVMIASRVVIYRHNNAIRRTEVQLVPNKGQNLRQISRCILNYEDVATKAGVPPAQVKAFTTALVADGYFDDKPLLAPSTEKDTPQITEIASRFAAFQGQCSWRVKTETIVAFINQFPPGLRSDMISALQRFIVLDRPTVRDVLLKSLSNISSTREMDIVGLSPNSGQVAREILEHETKGNTTWAHLRFRKSLAEALKNEGELLVFVDDNTSTATQARAQFLAWFGRPRDSWPPECQKEDGIFDESLDPNERQELQSREVWIVTCLGQPLAEVKLRPVLAAVGVNLKGIRYEQEITQSKVLSPKLKDYLQTVGCRLIADTRYSKSVVDLNSDEQADCEADALGYGNACGMLATMTNVPTASITALWCPGLFEGRPWMPLLVRQNKIRHLVLG